MCAAKGWVASITASIRSAARIGHEALGAAEAADALRDRRGRGLAVAPASDRSGVDSRLAGEAARERACFRRSAENEKAKALQGAAP